MAAGAGAGILASRLAEAVLASARLGGRDLTMRQFAIVLSVHGSGGPHTVRGLARWLGLPKPAVSLNLGRLESLGLVHRRRDPADRRSVLLERTPGGEALVGTVLHALAPTAPHPPSPGG